MLISIDSLRYDHVGCYGYPRPTTPRIDQLAAEGVRFQNAVSTTSWTLPAHAALFTGLYDSTHGLVDNGLRFGKSVVTLAEVLKEAGYRTAGFYGGPYLKETYGFAKGFDTYVSCMSKFEGTLPPEQMKGPLKGEAVRSFRDVTGPTSVEKVTEWLGTLDDRPFFLFVHLWDPHYDYIPPDEYVRMFDPDYRGTINGRNLIGNPRVSATMPKRDLEHVIALYDGEIRFTDDNLSKILTELGRRRRLDSSLIVVAADHGQEFFEHGGKGHQKTLYDEVVRIPLIFRWPGKLPAGRVVQDQVRIVDIMPTLLAVAGATLAVEVEGRDISPLLHGEAMEAEPALCELHAAKRQLTAVRTNSRKFISFPAQRWWKSGHQHFDLEADPGEHHALPIWKGGFFESRRVLSALRSDAEALRKRLGETVIAAEDIDEEQRERLRSLGYLD